MTWRTVTLLGFVAVAVAAALVELTARRTRRCAPLAGVLGAVLAVRWARALLLVGWLWLGWHLFVRVRWR